MGLVRTLLADPFAQMIVIEDRDRLMRFGSEYVKTALTAPGRRLVVTDPDEVNDDLMPDMVEILTSFCARLHARRSARSRATKAVVEAK